MDTIKLTVGQDVMVYPPILRRRNNEPIPATVTSVARVWCTIRAKGGQGTWRMRLDTRDEGNRQYSQHNAHFRTMEQHKQWQERADADAFLREEGIELSRRSRWDTAQGRIKLANLIRGHVAP